MERPASVTAAVDPKRQYLLGTVLLLFVVTLWVLVSAALRTGDPVLSCSVLQSSFIMNVSEIPSSRLWRDFTRNRNARPLQWSRYTRHIITSGIE